jgi:hypothetical protein
MEGLKVLEEADSNWELRMSRIAFAFCNGFWNAPLSFFHAI